MKKLFISFLLAVLAFSSTAFAGFDDVDYYTSYEESIVWMNENGVIDGYPDGSFGPDKCVNRVEFLKMLFEVLEVDVSSSSAELFADTPAGSWYEDYVKMARERGTVVGYKDGNFRPGQCVNRVEAVKMAVLEFNNGVVPEEADYYYWTNYSDVYESEWYYAYLNYAFSANLVGEDHIDWADNGYKFYPGGEMSRKEVAEMLYRMKALRDNTFVSYYNYYSSEPDLVGDSLLFYKECALPDVDSSDVELEEVFPADSSFVAVFDASNARQLANLETFMSAFPESGLKAKMIELYNEGVSNRLAYENSLEAVMEEDWKVGVAANMFDQYYDGDLFIAVKADAIDDLVDYVGYLSAKEMGAAMSCEREGDFVYWTSEDEYDDYYAAVYGDLFFVTNSEEARDAAVERIESKNGFSPESGSNLGYFYANFEVLPTIADEMDLPGVFEPFDEVYYAMSSDGQGLIFDSSINFSSGSDYIDYYRDYELSIVKKAPAVGTIFYAEEAVLAPGFEDFAMVADVDELFYELDLDIYDLAALLRSSYALQVSEVGQFYPGFVFYMQLNEDTVPVGEKLTDAVAGAIDEEIASAMEYDGYEEGLFMNVELNSGLKKFYIDVNTDDFQDLAEEEPFMAEFIGDFAFEFYYGVMDDDVLVFALYPDFDSAYGSYPLAQDSRYKAAVTKLDGAYGTAVGYVDFDNLSVYLEGIATFLDEEFYLSDDEMAEFNTFLDYLDALDYLIGGFEFNIDELKGKTYIKVD